MKKTFLVFSIVVAAVVLFTATGVRAATCEPGWCFETSGYRVDVADLSGNPISGGNFPVIDPSGNSVFTYKITKTGGKSLNHLDLLIPACMAAPTYPPACSPSCSGNPIATLYGPGLGDPNTGFGIGLTTYQAYVFNYSGPSGTISFTVAGKTFALPNAMLLNRGTGNYAYGQILSPACSATCDVFSTSVPLTITKVVDFGGLYVCLDSPDKSGCPTKIYSCCSVWSNDYDPKTGVRICDEYSPDPNPCNCLDQNKQQFVQVDLSVGGSSGHHLLEVWTESDPQCPITLTTTGSCPAYKTVLVAPGRYGTVPTYVVPPATATCVTRDCRTCPTIP